MQQVVDLIIREFKNNLNLFVLLSIFFAIETIWPYFKFKQNRSIHTFRNLGVLLFYLVVTTPINYIATAWYGCIDTEKFGLLHQFALPSFLRIGIGLLLMDCGDYFYHRISHRSNFIWRFHKIHHSDLDVDSTTAFRFHPIDNIGLVMMEMFTALIFGYGSDTIAIYFLIYLPLLFVQHANFRFPDKIERIFETIFATSNFHRIHHSYPQHYTDSNYGAVFSFWDRLFRTYQKADPKNIHYGLEDSQTDDQQSLTHLITGPFKSSR
ncbi:MAG: sterol desaturase family protein [Chitinophagaceae bacterium]|uniref:sterol desaturase family protein n=1 Tax=unclassified Paraflavitalea TaxID=2798305 RepID=UPI003D334B7D|nr:sterol desaturase family protein [Chitinophagaceae bacterium]